MSKKYVIENCGECPFMMWCFRNSKNKKNKLTWKDLESHKIPDWCPLLDNETSE